MATSGAQLGNNNAKKGMLVRDAMRKALKRHHSSEGSKKTALIKVCSAVIDKAQEGDIPAFNAIADRLDGKPNQAITGPNNTPITLVQRVIVQQVTDNNEVIEGEVITEQLEVSED